MPYPIRLTLLNNANQKTNNDRSLSPLKLNTQAQQGYFILGLGDDFSWFQPSDVKFPEV